ncbi:MAG TPA: response regulator [Longimicrobium sp.]
MARRRRHGAGRVVLARVALPLPPGPVTGAADQAPLILVVDDEPSNVDVLCDLLEALEYRTVGAGSGEAALALARDRAPDLVLLDVTMPGVDGLEACRRLTADPATASIPLVFVTALSHAGDRARGIDAGGDAFLNSPQRRHEVRLRGLPGRPGARLCGTRPPAGG